MKHSVDITFSINFSYNKSDSLDELYEYAQARLISIFDEIVNLNSSSGLYSTIEDYFDVTININSEP